MENLIGAIGGVEVGAVVLIVIIATYLVYCILRSPFHYPYYICNFDVSGKKNPQMEDWIDRFINDGNFAKIEAHYQKILLWEKFCEKKIEESLLKKFRMKQYLKCKDDNNAFVFNFIRQQTRYQQRNYVKSSYKVEVKDATYTCGYRCLQKRYARLKDIGFQCTLNEYNTKNQRKLMTKELRDRIMKRDNYTCQICGKYMPDQVGLHIDHIIPVSKGGKSVESNLQVTCDKCNLHKSNR